jgi:hypothetical protein
MPENSRPPLSGNENCTYVGHMSLIIHGFKYILIGLCLGLLISVRSFGAEPPKALQVDGVIKTDTVWSGTVHVVGDVLVPEGVTLTISPGTKVMFDSSESSKIEPVFLSMQTEIMVRGRLLVMGEKPRPVLFVSAPEGLNTKKPARGDWGGVMFDGEASGKSKISFASFEMADTAVGLFGASPDLSDIKIQGCKYGIVSQGNSAPKAARIFIKDCETGVVSSHGSVVPLGGMTFEKNERDSIIK